MSFQNFLDRVTSLIAVFALLAFLCSQSKAEDYDGPHHFNVVFHTETTVQEISWQALNVIDTEQTLYIAAHPDRFQEVGTTGIFCGPHPSKNGVLASMIGFAVLHYAVTVGIENLVQRNPDYEVLQRVWQYGMIVPKAYTVANNRRIGIK